MAVLRWYKLSRAFRGRRNACSFILFDVFISKKKHEGKVRGHTCWHELWPFKGNGAKQATVHNRYFVQCYLRSLGRHSACAGLRMCCKQSCMCHNFELRQTILIFDLITSRICNISDRPIQRFSALKTDTFSVLILYIACMHCMFNLDVPLHMPIFTEDDIISHWISLTLYRRS